MKFSYGFIETRGYVAAIEAADAMVKAAKVEVVKWRKAGGALVMVVVRGELGACRAAVDAGKVAAERVGELVASNVIANPYGDTGTLINEYLGGRKRRPSPPKPKPVVIAEKEIPPATKKEPAPIKQKTRVSQKQQQKKTPPAAVKPVTGTKKVQSKPAVTKTPAPAKPKVKKGASFSAPERLLHLIADAPEGLTLNQLSADFDKSSAEIRQMIKKLMDRNVIEKVQKRYFLIDSRSK